MDDVEAAVSGEMFPTIQVATPEGHPSYAPSGGTWWCYGFTNDSDNIQNKAVSGGARISTIVNGWQVMCIKIA